MTILFAAALFALAVSTAGGMLIWYYLDISRRGEPEPNQFHQNSQLIDEIE
jgi:hypothetical protein